jgi:hypothetical protein
MTKTPSRVPKGQTIYAKAHHLDGEDRVDGLELKLSSSGNGEQKLGDGTMELAFRRQGKWSPKEGTRSRLSIRTGQSARHDESVSIQSAARVTARARVLQMISDNRFAL